MDNTVATVKRRCGRCKRCTNSTLVLEFCVLHAGPWQTQSTEHVSHVCMCLSCRDDVNHHKCKKTAEHERPTYFRECKHVTAWKLEMTDSNSVLAAIGSNGGATWAWEDHVFQNCKYASCPKSWKLRTRVSALTTMCCEITIQTLQSDWLCLNLTSLCQVHSQKKLECTRKKVTVCSETFGEITWVRSGQNWYTSICLLYWTEIAPIGKHSIYMLCVQPVWAALSSFVHLFL